MFLSSFYINNFLLPPKLSLFHTLLTVYSSLCTTTHESLAILFFFILIHSIAHGWLTHTGISQRVPLPSLHRRNANLLPVAWFSPSFPRPWPCRRYGKKPRGRSSPERKNLAFPVMWIYLWCLHICILPSLLHVALWHVSLSLSVSFYLSLSLSLFLSLSHSLTFSLFVYVYVKGLSLSFAASVGGFTSDLCHAHIPRHGTFGWIQGTISVAVTLHASMATVTVTVTVIVSTTPTTSSTTTTTTTITSVEMSDSYLLSFTAFFLLLFLLSPYPLSIITPVQCCWCTLLRSLTVVCRCRSI